MSDSHPTLDDIEYLFFEFTTSAPITQVKTCFEKLTVIYSFKVYGAGHYLFLVKNDQSQELKSLTLPDDAQKNVSTFPVMTLVHFLNNWHIDVKGEEVAAPPLADKDLTFVERIWDPKCMTLSSFSFWKFLSFISILFTVTISVVTSYFNVCRQGHINEEQYKAVLSQLLKRVRSIGPAWPRSCFIAAATLPTTFFFFWQRTDCQTTSLLKKNSDAFGGPGSIRVRCLKIYNI